MGRFGLSLNAVIISLRNTSVASRHDGWSALHGGTPQKKSRWRASESPPVKNFVIEVIALNSDVHC